MALKPLLKRFFVGFSTQNSAKTGIRTLYDIDLINVDLMSAFQTRVGERVMRPDYGCKLWDYLMEPLTDVLRTDIIAEVIRICQLDSRCVVIDTQVFEQDQGFKVSMTLQYLPWLVIDTFIITFNQSDLTYFGSASSGNFLS
jgi:phage baseplate assembly protein W